MRTLVHALEPRSVALIGASDREGSVGAALLSNLSDGFSGPLDLVNPHHAVIAGRRAWASVAELPEAPDLAIVATPAHAVPEALAALNARGCNAAMVVADFSRADDAPSLEAIHAARGPMRVIGPGSLGVASPWLGLHATFAGMRTLKGGLAFVGESATAAGPIVDWANARRIGFAHIVALGGQADVDFADVLDFFAQSRKAEAVLIHLEHLKDSRRFLSAARALARIKPVIVMKSAGSDTAPARTAVWDAALRRAGLLRVNTLDEAFDAIEALQARMPVDMRPQSVGDRLVIIANGAAMASLACDTARESAVRLADLSPQTEERLAGAVARPGPGANPIDLMPDAGPERYRAALEAVIDDPGVDAVLVLNAPTGIAEASVVAETVADVVNTRRKSPGLRTPWVFASWPGGQHAQAAGDVFDAHHLAHFATPSDAVRAYGLLVRRRRTEIALTETPASRPEAIDVDAPAARAAIAAALDAGAHTLVGPEAQAVFGAYNINVETTSHSRGALRDVVLRITAQVDPDFGPFLRIKLGDDVGRRIDPGVAALPPLTSTLAEQAIEAGLAGRLLRTADGGRAAAATLLQKCAQLIADHAEVESLELDPVVVSQGAVRVLGARARLARPATDHIARNPASRLAIRPYPTELERTLTDSQGDAYVLRPIRPEDEPAIVALIGRLDPEHLRLRFFQPLSNVSHDFAARLTQIDYDREMALVLCAPHTPEAGDEGGQSGDGGDCGDGLGADAIYGVVRLVRSRDGESGEYAVTVDSHRQGRSLGALLMQAVIDYGRAIGLSQIEGFVLAENRTMLALNRKLGFVSALDPDGGGVVRVTLDLTDAHGDGAPTSRSSTSAA